MALLPLPVASIRPERVRNVQSGHPWIFSGALAQAPQAEDGALVRIQAGKQFLGIGYYNSRTDIAIRLLTRKDEPVDAPFFAARFRALRRLKETWLPPDTDAYRAVFGEADGLPGLVVDRYASVLSVQFHTAGMEALRDAVVEGLLEAHAPATVVDRSDVSARRAEGLEPLPAAILRGPPVKEVEIREQGHRFLVDVMEGQKTGFFLDQRENRKALQRWCLGRAVLNCFSYSGGFSVYAASPAAGARRVASVDISKHAMDLCRRNFALNGLTAHEDDFRVRDVFDHLKAIPPGEFDLILLDPPSFAKNRKQLPNAIKAYTTLNAMALEKLPEDGILVSSSCTSHVDADTFIKILHQSSVLARCTLRVLESREQPFDHPYNLSFPEGRYLKFFVLRKQGI